jgi:hypothetical protein
MGSKSIVLLLLLQALLSGSSIVHSTSEFTPSQDPSWSDDFEDGNYDDWVTYGGYQGDEKTPGNFTIVDGALFAQEHTWNWAFHDSEVVTGTWSMDIYAVDREHHELMVPFILENHTLEDIWKNGYMVQLLTGPYSPIQTENDGLALLRAITYPSDLTWFQYAATGELNGWQHLDITRDSYGQMCVYLNGTFYLSAIDNMITESTLFGFACREGHGIDNVTVTHNLITIDKVPPIWTTGNPSDVSIELNEPLRVELNVTDTSGIDSYWLNDTTQVSVNDTNGYTLSGSFNVIVSEAESVSIPMEWLFIGIVGIVAVIAIVVVIKLKKP